MKTDYSHWFYATDLEAFHSQGSWPTHWSNTSLLDTDIVKSSIHKTRWLLMRFHCWTGCFSLVEVWEKKQRLKVRDGCVRCDSLCGAQCDITMLIPTMLHPFSSLQALMWETRTSLFMNSSFMRICSHQRPSISPNSTSARHWISRNTLSASIAEYH